MLEKLITNLKNSLPEPLRKKLGGGEAVEENSDEELDGAEELKRYESDDSAGIASDAEKKKKQISMIIRVIVIIAIGYFAVDEFVLKKSNTGSEDPVDATIAKMEAKRKKRKEAAKAAADAAKTGAAKAGDSAAADPNSNAPAETTAASTDTATAPHADAPIENVNVLDKNDPLALNPVGTTSDSTPAGEITDSKIVDTSVDSKIDQLVESTPPVETKAPVQETQTSLSTPSTEEINIPSQPIVSSKKSQPKSDNSMASKIVEEVTETPAPAYDQVGRGLVYNCKDKYWACVDKPAYITCNKNMKWNKSNGHSAECVVQNIYSTDEDCAKIQKYNVSSSVATNFCQN